VLALTILFALSQRQFRLFGAEPAEASEGPAGG